MYLTSCLVLGGLAVVIVGLYFLSCRYASKSDPSFRKTRKTREEMRREEDI